MIHSRKLGAEPVPPLCFHSSSAVRQSWVWFTSNWAAGVDLPVLAGMGYGHLLPTERSIGSNRKSLAPLPAEGLQHPRARCWAPSLRAGLSPVQVAVGQRDRGLQA